jgi:hypothetical protein
VTADTTHLWGAATAVVGSLVSAVVALDKRSRADAESRLAEAKRCTEVLILATKALETSNSLQSRLLEYLEHRNA